MESRGFFEDLFASAGHRIDKGTEKIEEGTSKMKSVFENLSNGNNDTVDADPVISIVNYFVSRIGVEIELELIDSAFEYADILTWVKKDYKGNQLYLVKGKFQKSNSFIICAFFALDDKPLLGKNDTKKCYACKSIPLSINDLFGTKNIYIQPLK